MKSDLNLVIEIHTELTRLVHPATPETIEASDTKNNQVLKFLMIGGFLFALCFIASIAFEVKTIQIIAAAGLGITFQSLYAVNKYLKQSTFNPAYTQSYKTNYALGLFAGSILGFFGPELLSLSNGNTQITQSVLALIGGYSAEAVAQILQRVSEILVTAVKGNQNEKSEAEAKKAVTNQSTQIAARLTKSLDGDDKELKQKVETIIQDLLNSK